MSVKTIENTLEDIYASLANNNEGLDELIVELKVALKSTGKSEVLVEPEKLVQTNRQGRQMMKSYFKKRGVIVTFAA